MALNTADPGDADLGELVQYGISDISAVWGYHQLEQPKGGEAMPILMFYLEGHSPASSVAYNAQTVAEGVKVLKDAASCHFRNFVDEIVPIPTFDKAGYWKQLRTMNSTQKQKMDPQMMKRWVHIEPDLSDHAGWGPNGRRTAQA